MRSVLQPDERGHAGFQLGRGLDASGRLNDAGVKLALENLARFVWLARAMEVTRLDLLATAAVRDAENGPGFVADVERRCGVLGERDLRRFDRQRQPMAELLLQDDLQSRGLRRLNGVGRISRDDAIELGAVGPTARASGVAADVRTPMTSSPLP